MGDEPFDQELADEVKRISAMPWGPDRRDAWGKLLSTMPSGPKRHALKDLVFNEIYGHMNDAPDPEIAALAAERQEEFLTQYPALKVWVAEKREEFEAEGPEKGRFVMQEIPTDIIARTDELLSSFGITEVTFGNEPLLDDGEMMILKNFSWPSEPITIAAHDVPQEVLDLVVGGDPEPTCFRCGKTASELWKVEAEIEGMTPDEYAREDGTYNGKTNHFACDGCYIAIGQPSGSRGWKAP